MDQPTSFAVDWLLASDEPAIRAMAGRDLLDKEPGAADQVLAGPKVAALLSGQQADGGFGGRPYKKWTGAHWRLARAIRRTGTTTSCKPCWCCHGSAWPMIHVRLTRWTSWSRSGHRMADGRSGCNGGSRSVGAAAQEVVD
jgi:hypothetical protein